MRFAGVVGTDDSVDELNPAPRPGGLSLCSAASSAASLIDMAELFLCVVLNWNLAFGANLDLVSCNFSSRALMAYLN